MKKYILMALTALSLNACASLTNDAMTPIAMSFSDGSDGKCDLQNKRGVWTAELPDTVFVRRSDDALKYDCTTENGTEALGIIQSKMGAKIVASAVFLDFGIVDSITDKHREYPESFVIPVKREKK